MHRKQLAHTRQKRVLVVEDDVWNRWVMRDLLSDEGYAVIEAADGRTGLRMVDEYSPDIVLLDVAMPEFTGVDVLRHLRSRRRTRNLPVVVLSTYTRALPKQDVASVAGILRKPVSVEELLTTFRRILEPNNSAESESRVIDGSEPSGAAKLDVLQIDGLARAYVQV